MDVTIAGNAGFCGGVRRVVNLVENALSDNLRPLYTIGEIVHNRRVVEMFRDRGVQTVSTANDVPGKCTAVIRAHGLPAEEISVLRAKDINLLDGTCGKVAKVTYRIRECAVEGRLIYIAGEHGHAEMKTHTSIAPGSTVHVAGLKQLMQMSIPRIPSALFAQTTFSPSGFSQIKDHLTGCIGDLKVFDTICNWTLEAQRAAAEVAGQVDLMIVVGGKNSANTARLVEVSRGAGAETVLIESVDELRDYDFTKIAMAGITGGASTLPADIDEVRRFLERI